MRRHRRRFPRLAAAAAASIASCTANNGSPPGELMVVVTTDASPPKDINTLHVQVLSSDRSSPQFDNEYSLGPGGLLLPATLGVVAGDHPADPATIRVYALNGSTLRVLREATVTVPTDRLAMLRMPINWLCYDDAAEQADGGGVIESKCPGQTCAAGDCVDSTIADASTLPAFAPASVFGGGTGDGGGTCFDTLSCFAAPIMAAVDPSDCSIPKPTGGEGINVAMVVATGVGACAPAGAPCYIALDGESAEGWNTSASDSTRIQLPKEVCRRLTSGKLSHVVTTTTCATKGDSTPPCGPGSSVGASGVDAGGE